MGELRGNSWARRAAALIAAVTAVALVATSCAGDDNEKTAKSPDPASSVSTDGITGDVKIRNTDVEHPVTSEEVEPLAPVVDITTDGSVSDGATVSVDLDAPLAGGEFVVAFTAESKGGPWEPLPVEVSDTTATASIEHLSLFSFLRFPNPADVVEELFNDITADFFAAATHPTCDDEDGARSDGYDIGSEGSDVLMWCLGRDGDGRYLRVVNNRRYPVILSSSLPVRDGHEARGITDRLASALANGGIALPPLAQVTYGVDVPAGRRAAVRAEFDGLAYSLYQLQVGVELAGSFLSRFGTKTPDARTLDRFLSDAGCVDALVAAAPGRILSSCLDYDGLSSLFGGFGAAIAAPFFLAAGVVSFFQTAASSGFDLVTGRDAYSITITRAAAAPPPATAPRTPPPLASEQLVARYTELNDGCRGGSGDEADTWVACDLREGYMVALGAQGLCFGTSFDFLPCNGASADTFDQNCDVAGVGPVAVADVPCAEAAEVVEASEPARGGTAQIGRFTCEHRSGWFFCGDYGSDLTTQSTTYGALAWAG